MSKFERLLMPGSTELNEISRSFVDMVVPAGGLGNKLDAMYEFHAHAELNRSAVRASGRSAYETLARVRRRKS